MRMVDAGNEIDHEKVGGRGKHSNWMKTRRLVFLMPFSTLQKSLKNKFELSFVCLKMDFV